MPRVIQITVLPTASSDTKRPVRPKPKIENAQRAGTVVAELGCRILTPKLRKRPTTSEGMVMPIVSGTHLLKLLTRPLWWAQRRRTG